MTEFRSDGEETYPRHRQGRGRRFAFRCTCGVDGVSTEKIPRACTDGVSLSPLAQFSGAGSGCWRAASSSPQRTPSNGFHFWPCHGTAAGTIVVLSLSPFTLSNFGNGYLATLGQRVILDVFHSAIRRELGVTRMASDGGTAPCPGFDGWCGEAPLSRALRRCGEHAPTHLPMARLRWQPGKTERTGLSNYSVHAFGTGPNLPFGLEAVGY